jgi:hypothetical protein
MSSNPDLRVELRRNDGSETFRLKADTVETAVENGLVTDSIISGASRAVLGGKLVLEIQRYTIDFVIQGMGPNDYPNSSTYDGSSASTPDNDDYGFREELMRASKEWGFDAGNGFDTLVYDGRQIDGVITAFNPVEDTSNRPARTYDATLEWTFLDGYIS